MTDLERRGRPRHVVIFINLLTRGGAEVQMLRLARQLASAGNRVTLMAIEPPTALEDRLQGVDVPSIVLTDGHRGPLQGPRALAGAVATLRRLRPDVLICAVYQATILGRIAGRLAGVPVIVSSLRNERQTRRLRDTLLRVTAPLDHWTTTNSSRAAARLAETGIVPRNRLDVIPNALERPPAQVGADATRRDTIRRQLGVEVDAFLWVAVGRLEPQKDHATLLRAFEHLQTTDGDARRHRLLIVGTGRLHDELSTRVATAPYGDRVHLLGARDDVPALLSAADGLVLSSRWEGLPNVVMEAMAAGRPVVATRVGGVPELVAEGTTGLLVDPGDPRGLAEAMDRIGRMTSAERAAWGEQGRRRVAELCDPERVAQQWVDLLNRLDGRRRASAAEAR